ncbi:hypothetical protein A3K86_06270 [Photobacterium jeanii]|uniref:HTH araC/xylS-type domain-containing protein n=1 Tax=Photobacterium jeanii TaxID=858640 RepID=A0A178KMC0_9GAMM|nr:AraC family transcriptional regulator [Photobacterium jeanii]OAN18489.1 hypothetical protein A3K86_06270 [Photobacterium jeanii]
MSLSRAVYKGIAGIGLQSRLLVTVFWGFFLLYSSWVNAAHKAIDQAAFYTFPLHNHTNQFSIVEMIDSPSGAGLFMRDAKSKVYFYDGRRAHSLRDNQGQRVRQVKALSASEQYLWLLQSNRVVAYSLADRQLVDIPLPTEDAVVDLAVFKHHLWLLTAKGMWVVSLADTERYLTYAEPLSFTSIPLLTHGDVTGLIVESDHLWLTTHNAVHQVLASPSAHHPLKIAPVIAPPLVLPRVTSMALDQAGRIWLGTEKGLFVQQGAEAVQQVLSHPVIALSSTQQGVWVGTQQGLFVVDEGTEYARRIQAKRYDPLSISDDRIEALHRDQSGSLWIANQGGINFLPQIGRAYQRVRFGLSAQTISAKWINDMVELENGDIWLATDQGLVALTPDLEPFQRVVTHGEVNQIASDGKHLWLATEFGLKRYDLNKAESDAGSSVTNDYQKIALPSWFENAGIRHILTDRYGSVWFAKQSMLYRYWPSSGELVLLGQHWLRNAIAAPTMDNLLEHKLASATISPRTIAPAVKQGQGDTALDESIQVLFEDHQGQIWIGTSRYLYVMAKQQILKVPMADDLGGVRRLYQDHQQQLWVAMDNGVILIKDVLAPQATFFSYRSTPVHPSCLLVDGERLWVAAQQGLGTYSPQDNSPRYFTPPFGMIANEIDSAVCLQAQNGKLLFSGREGVLSVDNQQLLAPSNYASQVIVSEIIAGEHTKMRAHQLQQPFIFNYGDILHIKLGLFPFVDDTSIAFRLIGSDDQEWHQLDGYELFFDGLAPGQYQLELLPSDRESEHHFHTEATVLMLEVLPPWYYSLKVLLISGLLVALLVGVIYRWRAYVAEKQNVALKQAIFRKTARIEQQKLHLSSRIHVLQHQVQQYEQNSEVNLIPEQRSMTSSCEVASSESCTVHDCKSQKCLEPSRDNNSNCPTDCASCCPSSYPEVKPEQSAELSLWGEQVKGLIEAHFHNPNFGTAVASQALYISERSLQRKFKSEFGVAFKEYVNQFRFTQAKLMLAQGDRVSDVAMACGFNEPSYFSYRFKQKFAMTPSQYAAQFTD